MNKSRYARNAYKYDEKLTAMMVEDMLFDPILAAKVLLDVDIPPHMELRLLQIWTTQFTVDDSGFSTGKSFTFAVAAAIRSILLQGRISGIISGTFRQGKLIFQNFDRWYQRSRIFRSCIRVVQGKPKLVHGNDVWTMEAWGGSEVRVLPPNWAADSEQLRSERWHDFYGDEYTIFGNVQALTKTIFGRVTAPNKYEHCPVRQNHIHLGSTPGFTHDPAYAIVKKVQSNITVGNENYGRYTSNYRHIPRREKWNFLVSRKTIFSMQTMNPPGLVAAEIDGRWQKDSMSYYSSAAIHECRRKVNVLRERHSAKDVYVFGFDTARGNARAKKGGDDFALVVWRIARGAPPYPCYMIRRQNIGADVMAGIIHECQRRFHCIYGVYDPGGGGLFVRDELKNQEQLIRGNMVHCTPMLDYNENSGILGDMILLPFRRSTYHVGMLWGKMASDSVLVNRMHKAMKASIETKRVTLPGKWAGWDKFETYDGDVDSMRSILNHSARVNEVERMHAELDLAVSQLVHVDVKRGPDREPIMDGNGMYKFKSKHKKDSAYSMIYGYVGVCIYNYFRKNGHIADESEAGEDMIASCDL